MICRKCGTVKKESVYCEKCGTEYKKEDINVQNIPSQNKQKINKKNFTSFIITVLLITSLLITYYKIESNLTDKAEIERYCNYLVKAEYKKAYNMMSGMVGIADEKSFIRYMEMINPKKKKIESIEKIELNNVNFDYNENISSYRVTIGSDEMMFQVVKDDKKLFYLFDNWEVSTKGMIKDYQIIVPEDSRVFVDNVEVNVKSSTYNTYADLQAFPGSYKVKVVKNNKEKLVDFVTANGNKLAVEFDKEIEQVKENIVAVPKETEKPKEEIDNKLIENLMNEYQDKLIKAINQKDFTIIESMLIFNSSLYKDNKKLIGKGYKEKLIKCNIETISLEDGRCCVYTSEEVEVKTLTDKIYKKYNYKWKYSLEKEWGQWKFSKIEKWQGI